MSRHIRSLLTIIPAALILTSHWQPAAAQAPEPQRLLQNTYDDGVGVYTAIGRYGGGPSFITVTVRLEDGVVTDVAVTPHATVQTSLEFQRSFAAAVPEVVVGRPISEINVGTIAGSSSTPDGFNDAIRQIREQAAQ